MYVLTADFLNPSIITMVHVMGCVVNIAMIDAGTLWLWATDVVLLALAYWVGRIHAGANLRDTYLRELSSLIDEVKVLRRKVDVLAKAREQ